MKWLDKCLSSVVDSSVDADLFIVDNGSTDGTIEFIKDNYSHAVFIESKENLGFGRANNLGLRYALDNGYDYVYLLNQDAWVEPNTFKELIEVSVSNPEYGILSPLQVNREKTKLDKNFTNYCCPKELISDAILGVSKKRIYETEMAMAAHWLITSSCIQTVGAFSPTFFHYGEDNNYIDRVQFNKLKVGIVPEVKGIHDREFREISYKQSLHFFYTACLIKISNPNLRNQFVRILYISMIESMKKLDLNYLKIFLRIACRMRTYRYNLKLSKTSGAFIKNN